MIDKYFHKDHHHVTDREIDELYQYVRKHDENYVLEETIIKNKRKFFSSWWSEDDKIIKTYTLYHYNGSDYVAVENNVNKYDIVYFFKGILHSRR